MRNFIKCKDCGKELETRSERSIQKCEDCQLA
jgi:ribosomal protein L37AE/L43A